MLKMTRLHALAPAALSLILLVLFQRTTDAQCGFNTQLGQFCGIGSAPTFATVLSADQGSTAKIYAGQTGTNYNWATYSGACYGVSTCNASVDTQIGVYSATSGNSSPFAYDDDNGPYCTGTGASMNFISNYSGNVLLTVRQYNCQSSQFDVNLSIRQNNNLSITSSNANMCEGMQRTLTATPAAQPTAIPDAGDRGTFTGTNVSGTTFTAPVPAGATSLSTITYNFGYCSTTQSITVYRAPQGSIVTSSQSIQSTSLNVQAATTFGTGTWSAGDPQVTFSPNTSATNATANNLPIGTTTLYWTVVHGPCASAVYSIDVTRTAPMPLELLDFSAERHSDAIQLSWATAREENVRYFDIERSVDAAHFNTIGKVPASGAAAVTYDFQDTRPIDEKESYYRLKIVETDGSFQYSGLARVAPDKSENIWNPVVFPNPVAGESDLKLRLANCPEKQLKAILFDPAGKMVQENSFEGRKDQLDYLLKLPNALPGGVYLLCITDGEDHMETTQVTIR